jgi:competence protein ComEA
VNINTASKKELEQLPGIGGQLAERIIDHRTRFGVFRKPEHLLMVDGISAGRLEEIAPLITVE